MQHAEPPVIPTVVEITRPAGLLHLGVWIQFIPHRVSPNSMGWVPRVVHAEDMDSGEELNMEQVRVLITDKRMLDIVESIHWWAVADEDIDPHVREMLFEALGDYKGEAMLPLG